jgi:hypothetical protein
MTAFSEALSLLATNYHGDKNYIVKMENEGLFFQRAIKFKLEHSLSPLFISFYFLFT